MSSATYAVLTGVRFWVWHTEGYVRLHLRPGQTLRWHAGGPDDEGWSYRACAWSLDEDGQTLRLDEYTDGVDCDGRLSREWHYRCPVRHRDAHRAPGGMGVPLWEVDSQSQRDYAAEAMGY